MNKFSVFVFTILCTFNLVAQPQPSQLAAISDDIEDQVIAWRHHFHEFPELSNREFKTAAYVEKYLKSLGWQVTTGVARTELWES